MTGTHHNNAAPGDAPTPTTDAESLPEPAAIRNGQQPLEGTVAVIAGSRAVTDILTDELLLRLIARSINMADFVPTAVVSGTATGVDTAGEDWATSAGLPVAEFPARWNNTDHPDAVVKHGAYGSYDAKAGIRRNEQMAVFAKNAGDRGVLLAIQVFEDPDTPTAGTANMVAQGRDILGDDNVFVVPLGNHPSTETLTDMYGSALLLSAE